MNKISYCFLLVLMLSACHTTKNNTGAADTAGKCFAKVMSHDASQSEDNPKMEWQEVVCEADITVALLRDIHSILVKAGLNPGPHPMGPELTPAFTEALGVYQIKNQLPQGHLDMETMAHMGLASEM